jgi:hypothetical protein
METDAGHVVTQVNQLCGIGKRKRLQQHVLDYGEDGAVRADADGQGGDSNGGECWEGAEPAEDVFECGHILVSPPRNQEDVEQAHSVSSITRIPAFEGFNCCLTVPLSLAPGNSCIISPLPALGCEHILDGLSAIRM